MPRSHHKKLLAGLIAALWVLTMVAAFWWFEARYLRPFSERTALFDGSVLQLPAELAGPGTIRLVHFWDPTCPCTVGNQQHLAELVARYDGQGVDFHAVRKAGTVGQLPDSLQALKTIDALPGSEQLPASPAVAIWDRQGRLAYFGPYSNGFSCTSGNSFIEPVLDALLQERQVAADNTLASGCFCNWRDPD